MYELPISLCPFAFPLACSRLPLPLLLHAAELHAVHEILLQERIHDEDRHGCHDRDGRPDRYRRDHVERGVRIGRRWLRTALLFENIAEDSSLISSYCSVLKFCLDDAIQERIEP